MKKTTFAVLLIYVSVACEAFTIAKAPILFQGMDEVPLTSVCEPKATDPEIDHQNYSYILKCLPRIDEYAGEKLIRKNLAEIFSSHVEYDGVTKRVTNIKFFMQDEAYEGVEKLLEAKYGKGESDNGYSHIKRWFGDQYGIAAISLGTLNWPSGSYTELTIHTHAMAEAWDKARERDLRNMEEKKAKAFKAL